MIIFMVVWELAVINGCFKFLHMPTCRVNGTSRRNRHVRENIRKRMRKEFGARPLTKASPNGFLRGPSSGLMHRDQYKGLGVIDSTSISVSERGYLAEGYTESSAQAI